MTHGTLVCNENLLYLYIITIRSVPEIRITSRFNTMPRKRASCMDNATQCDIRLAISDAQLPEKWPSVPSRYRHVDQ